MSMRIFCMKIDHEYHDWMTDVPYYKFEYENAPITKEDRNEKLEEDQSLNDLLIRKLVEGLLGKTEIILNPKNGYARIEYSNKLDFWVDIKKEKDGSILIEGHIPAA